MLIRSALLILTCLALPAFATDMITLTTCDIQGELRLVGPTKIECDGTLKIADDAVIVRDGHLLAFFAPSFDAGKSRIECFDQNSASTEGKCEEMQINAITLAGSPTVDTNGLGDEFGGDVVLSYGSKNAFNPQWKLGRAAGLVDLTTSIQ